MTYKCVIIDDSSVHRMAISFLIKNHPKLKLIGAYANPYEGIEAIYKHKVDIVFLDVLLEDVNAFELLEAVEMPANIVLNSSWERFSSKATQFGIQNFLVKPMRKAVFEDAVDDVINSLEKQEALKLSQRTPYITRASNVFDKSGAQR